jgi:hypothetical protein
LGSRYGFVVKTKANEPLMSQPDISARPKRGIRVTGVQAGVIMAVAAVAAGTLFEVRPPEAYGICMACHGRDLVNSVINGLLGTSLTIAPASAIFPLLTTVGVVLGAWIAAVMSGEFRFRMPRAPWKSLLNGVLVMNFALIAAGCATRLALRTSAGDPLGLIGFVAMVVGVVAATVWMRRKALR